MQTSNVFVYALGCAKFICVLCGVYWVIYIDFYQDPLLLQHKIYQVMMESFISLYTSMTETKCVEPAHHSSSKLLVMMI